MVALHPRQYLSEQAGHILRQALNTPGQLLKDPEQPQLLQRYPQVQRIVGGLMRQQGRHLPLVQLLPVLPQHRPYYLFPVLVGERRDDYLLGLPPPQDRQAVALQAADDQAHILRQMQRQPAQPMSRLLLIKLV